MPLRLRHDYAAGFHRDLPAGDICRLGSSLHLRADTRHGPAHIRQVGAGGLLLRGFQMLVSHVHLSVLLAGPESSDSADSSRRCQGCLPSFFPSRKSDALSFFTLLRQRSGGVLSPPHGSKAPRGAQCHHTRQYRLVI
jgi:hypothetical protein